MAFDSLVQNGYVLVETLPHGHIIPFIQKWLKKKTIASVAFIVVNILVITLLIINFATTNLTLDDSPANFGLGVFLAFLLIPVHEMIHGIAYKPSVPPRFLTKWIQQNSFSTLWLTCSWCPHRNSGLLRLHHSSL